MTSALEGVRGQRHAPAAPYPRGKNRYTLYKRLGGHHGRSGQVRKISPPPGFDPRTVQAVGSRCTDYATRPYTQYIYCIIQTVSVDTVSRTFLPCKANSSLTLNIDQTLCLDFPFASSHAVVLFCIRKAFCTVKNTISIYSQ